MVLLADPETDNVMQMKQILPNLCIAILILSYVLTITKQFFVFAQIISPSNRSLISLCSLLIHITNDFVPASALFFLHNIKIITEGKSIIFFAY